MSLFDRLVKQLGDRGLTVEPGLEPGQLVLKGPKEGKTPEIMRAVKAFKPLLLERFGVPLPPPPKADTPPAADPEGESTGRQR